MYKSEKNPSGRNTPSPVPSLSLGGLPTDTPPTEDTPLLRRGFVAGSDGIPLLPIAGIAREDSPAPLLRRGPADDSSSDTSSESQESSTILADANEAASEGGEDTQDDLSADPFDNLSTEDDQASIFPEQPVGLFPQDAGTSSSTTSVEPPRLVEEPMSVTTFMQACMHVIEDANKALDDPGSELSGIFPPGIEMRRTFLKTALSLVSNWRAYKNVSQRDIFFESEFNLKKDSLLEYIEYFNHKLYARETGKYSLIRSAYLLKIILFMMELSKNKYEEGAKERIEIKNKLMAVVRLFSEAAQNPAYRDDTVPSLFNEYLDEAELVSFQYYLAQMIAADRQIEAAAIIVKSIPYRFASPEDKQAVLDAFKAGLHLATQVSHPFELAVVLDRKLMAITDPKCALSMERYQHYWIALKDWGKKLNRDSSNQDKRFESLIKLIQKTAKSSNKIYITVPCLRQIQAASSQEVLAQTFDDALFLQTNNESAQFVPMFLDPNTLNPLDFERFLGPIEPSITDFRGNTLLPSQAVEAHREVKVAPVPAQSICSSSSDHASTSDSHRQTSSSGFFRGVRMPGKKTSSSTPASSSSYVETSTGITSTSSVLKPPSSSRKPLSGDPTEKKVLNPLHRPYRRP